MKATVKESKMLSRLLKIKEIGGLTINQEKAIDKQIKRFKNQTNDN